MRQETFEKAYDLQKEIVELENYLIDLEKMNERMKTYPPEHNLHKESAVKICFNSNSIWAKHFPVQDILDAEIKITKFKIEALTKEFKRLK